MGNVFTGAKEKKLGEIVSELEALKAQIEELQTDTQEKFDAMGEKAQEGERGNAFSEAASGLESIAQSIDEALTTLEDVRYQSWD